MVKCPAEDVDNLIMDNIVILNACCLSEYAFMELRDGKTPVQHALEAASMMPESSDIAVIVPEGKDYSGYFKGFKTVCSQSQTAAELISILSGLSEGCRNIFYYNADCALTDPVLAQKMYRNHTQYFCEYTFADGFPAGISVEIIKTAILPALAEIAEKNEMKLQRNTLFSLIEKDINAFEIETEISPDDQRLLRVSLFPDTKRNYLQLKNFSEVLSAGGSENGKRPAAGDILKAVRTESRFLRTLPVFFEFEITGTHPQNVSYMPAPWNSGGRTKDASEMDLDSFKNALDKIKGFSDDAVISLSVRNEPALHSRVGDFAAAVLDSEKFSLLIETSGLRWHTEALERICSLDQSRITWIVDLDAYDRNLYAALRGGSPSDYDTAFSFAEKMINRFPENVYVQAVRMKENEVDTEQFYKYWKEKSNNVIIQKYDWCCGILEQRKVTDLSPLERLPCWHLKRELTVRTDGTVPLCRDDLENERICGNIFNDELSVIWKNGGIYYKQHMDEEYPGICRNCDEYYTYNY